MTPLVLIRHGATEWNSDGRIQGRADPPLSAAGRFTVESWRLPDEMTGALASEWTWLTSPLKRARETAALLRPGPQTPPVRSDPALVEMHWGAWEGRRLDELRAEGGQDMAAEEARGLDFRPPGGESPRDVQARLLPLLHALAGAERPTAAVTHKGVIRALYALASGWDMTGRQPETLRDACVHGFLLDPHGKLGIDRLNLSLS